jgi:hypothetical protein
MCYCEFNDIMPSMTALDADVISIETSRSNMELLKSSPHSSTQMTSGRAFMISALPGCGGHDRAVDQGESTACS